MNVAICFYTPESFKKLKQVAADKKNLDDTYEEWLFGFHNAMQMMKTAGHDAIAFKVDLDQLQDWLKKHKLKNTGKSRSQYASEMAAKQIK